MQKTRCFVSLELPNSFVEEIVRIQQLLKEENSFTGSYTKKENIHLTLKFLGEITDKEIEKVKVRLFDMDLHQREAGLGEVGVFNPNYIRIVWVHLAGVNELQRQVDNALSDMFEKENRFMSHITLARVKHIPDKGKLLETIKNIQVKKITEKTSKITLKKSTLTPKGPIYEVIETCG